MGPLEGRARVDSLGAAMEGRFTRLFPDAPAATFTEADTQKLAEAMTADPDIPPTPETEVDAEENPAITAGVHLSRPVHRP